jgi:hypothetical protein
MTEPNEDTFGYPVLEKGSCECQELYLWFRHSEIPGEIVIGPVWELEIKADPEGVHLIFTYPHFNAEIQKEELTLIKELEDKEETEEWSPEKERRAEFPVGLFKHLAGDTEITVESVMDPDVYLHGLCWDTLTVLSRAQFEIHEGGATLWKTMPPEWLPEIETTGEQD